MPPSVLQNEVEILGTGLLLQIVTYEVTMKDGHIHKATCTLIRGLISALSDKYGFHRSILHDIVKGSATENISCSPSGQVTSVIETDESPGYWRSIIQGLYPHCIFNSIGFAAEEWDGAIQR